VHEVSIESIYPKRPAVSKNKTRALKQPKQHVTTNDTTFELEP
jgi:hypothetical protein